MSIKYKLIQRLNPSKPTEAKKLNSKRVQILSLSINLFFVIVFCFGAYYKRDSINRYIGTIYNNIFNTNEKLENAISAFNPVLYQTDIKNINKDKFGRNIKIAILGNSISLHQGIENIWEHECGMAASDLEHDYVHILLNKISEEKQCNIDYIVFNIANFERDFEQFNGYDRFDIVKQFEPEIIIFQIGENVSTKALVTKGEIFVKNYMKIVEYCNGKNTIICLPFWPVKEKLNLITQVALKSGTYLVDLSHLGSGIDPLNLAKSETKYKHAGVAAHPGDYGMRNIAEMLYITVDKILE